MSVDKAVVEARLAEFARLSKGLTAAQCGRIASECNRSCNWRGSPKRDIAEAWSQDVFMGGGKFNRPLMRKLLREEPRRVRKTATEKREEETRRQLAMRMHDAFIMCYECVSPVRGDASRDKQFDDLCSIFSEDELFGAAVLLIQESDALRLELADLLKKTEQNKQAHGKLQAALDVRLGVACAKASS